MKQFFTSLLMCFVSLTTMAQGWPADYKGVMLQGFYWDSYTDTKWTNLESQADELSQFFDLIWVPQSGYCNATTMQMGYSDIWWLDHKSCFGTEAELRSMIAAFKAKNVGVIEDVVINHKNGNTSWCDFPNESKNGYTLTWDNTNFSGICQDDECNSTANLPKWSTDGKKTTGAKDTGSNFDGARDLDHTNAQVQQNIKTYLDFLMKDLGYTGFRYDMVGGYSPSYVGIYNTSAKPAFSVGEYWMSDGKTGLVNWINGTKVDGVIQSAAFDFSMKWNINTAFENSNWAKLNEEALSNDASYARYAVTFVDNHDTYREENNRLDKNVCAANAFILTLPGTPCLFLSHWKDYKGSLKKMITVRKAVGISNESTILQSEVKGGGYVLKVQGTQGTLMLLLGGGLQDVSTTGFKLATEGRKYKMYVSEGVDISAVSAITDTDAKTEATTTIPSFCTVEEGETCAFFEAPVSWGSYTVNCWCWDKQYNYTGGSWPGVACTKVGTANGKGVWKWSYKESDKKPASGNTNEGIIFNISGKQTGDMAFVSGGYYQEDGLWDTVQSATGIQTVKMTDSQPANASWYDLQGRKLSGEPTTKGIYIYQGKKVIK